MRVSTNQFYNQATSQMSLLSKQADTLSAQISTGKKYIAPSDNATAWTQLANLKTADTNADAWSANITLAQALVSQSDTVLGNVTNELQRAKELATQANSDALQDSDRGVIATELRGILANLAGIAQTKDARGEPLFAGSNGQTVSVASNGAVTITASGKPAAIPIGSGTNIQATDNASRVFGGVAGPNGTVTDMFTALSSLIDAVRSGTGIGDAATVLDAAATRVSDVRAAVGARGNRLDIEAASLKTASDDREVLRSGIEDVDISTAITQLQKTMTILSATQASFTKLSSLSLFDYLR